jgi:hypothetical protein
LGPPGISSRLGTSSAGGAGTDGTTDGEPGVRIVEGGGVTIVEGEPGLTIVDGGGVTTAEAPGTTTAPGVTSRTSPVIGAPQESGTTVTVRRANKFLKGRQSPQAS